MNYYLDNSNFLSNFSNGGIAEIQTDKYKPWLIFTVTLFSALAVYVVFDEIRKYKLRNRKLVNENIKLENDNSNQMAQNHIV